MSDPMDARYRIADTSAIFSPALIFYKDLIRENLDNAVRMVGNPSRLRPHMKTHKTREIIKLALEAGVTKHKCATLAEAELAASVGAPDVLIAYPIVGPNCGRLARLVRAFPKTRFSVLADHPKAVEALSKALSAEGQSVDVVLDLDVGMQRTGIAPGPDAIALYDQIHRSPALKVGGLSVYDGQNHQESLAERETAVNALLEAVLAMRKELEARGLPVPRIVGGGTPTFPVWAKLDIPGLECSPGTCILHDNGYGSRYTEMTGFTPAALLFTRVISRPSPTRVTFDLGYKAVASDPPAGKRLVLLDVPEYQAVLQNEEHLVIETPSAERFQPGDEAFAIPTHICPTCAMHKSAYVVEGGRVVGTWEIAGRDRVISV
jgi:D-serine deaminase-like pyridoxal phosphate-dependent protein